MAELFFGDFRLDTRRLQLEGPDDVIEVRAKALELLTYLIQNRNRFVPRDELEAALWQGVTVTSSSLTQCVSELRQALGDSAREPRYIETRVKFGYRFIATVYHRPTEQLVPLPPPDPEAPPQPARPARPARRWWYAAAAVIIVIVAIALLVHRLRPAPGPAHPTLVLVTATAGGEANRIERRIAAAVRDEVLGRLAALEGFSVTTDSRASRLAGGLEVEIACVRRTGGGIELDASLRRVETGEISWGWTWSFVDDDAEIDALVDEVASRLIAVLQSRIEAPG